MGWESSPVGWEKRVRIPIFKIGIQCLHFRYLSSGLVSDLSTSDTYPQDWHPIFPLPIPILRFGFDLSTFDTYPQDWYPIFPLPIPIFRIGIRSFHFRYRSSELASHLSTSDTYPQDWHPM